MQKMQLYCDEQALLVTHFFINIEESKMMITASTIKNSATTIIINANMINNHSLLLCTELYTIQFCSQQYTYW